MTTLVRAALSVRTSQGPGKAFQEHLARLEVDCVDIGHKYHNHVLFGDTLFLAARCMQAYTATELSAPLNGLGVRGDFLQSSWMGSLWVAPPSTAAMERSP